MARKKISELTSLESASLDTVVVGVDNGVTYKIELDILADGVKDRINTLDAIRLNNLQTFSASTLTRLDEIESQNEQLNSFTQSQNAANTAFTNGINSRLQTSSFETFSASVDTRIIAATNEQDLTYLVTTSSFNEYTASISTGSLVDRLSNLESNTGSYLTSLNGTISSSAQISTLGFISESVDISALNSFTQSQNATNTAFTNGINARLTTASFNEYTASQSNTVARVTGSWTVPAGTSTQSITLDSNASYSMWVRGNIPMGIIVWNATVTLSNTNVPVIGNQYGWYYAAGNALVLDSIPSQIIGTSGGISNAQPSVGTTTNVFEFGITNNSGEPQTINWGYIKL